MIIRNLDENHDFTFGKGKNNYLQEVSAIGLNIKTRVLSWLNDCFFAQQEGIDWYNRLGSKDQKELLDLDLQRVIAQSFGVTGNVSFDSILIDRDYTANFVVNTVFSKEFQDSIKVGL